MARDTIVNVYSVTRPLAATCVLRLVELGRLELDGRVADVWPAFAAAGKESVTVRLTHQAGLDLFEHPLPPAALLDRSAAVPVLEGAAPRWAARLDPRGARACRSTRRGSDGRHRRQRRLMGSRGHDRADAVEAAVRTVLAAGRSVRRASRGRAG